jgi:DNA-binding transcriptional regulator YiaG
MIGAAKLHATIHTMPNIATVLKSEISRLARKEVRSETDSLKKLSSQYRSDIAALKRQVKTLERLVKSASRGGSRAAAGDDDEDEEGGGKRLRFSAKRLASQRNRLGLSANDFGALVGVSGQSIYKWEAGEVRPRMSQLKGIAAVRAMGKREAQAKLAALRRK